MSKKNKNKQKKSQQSFERQNPKVPESETAEQKAAQSERESVPGNATPTQKFCDEIGRHKKLVERDIGCADFDWPFVVADFEGEVLKPAKLTPFDKAVCDLLFMRNFGWAELGKKLGLDIESDVAERDLLFSEIGELGDAGMLQGDKSVFWLSETGKEYVRKGEKIKTYQETFSLCIDPLFGFNDEGKIFSKLQAKEVNEEGDARFGVAFLDTLDPEAETLDEEGLKTARTIASAQAPEVHCPKTRHKLVACKPTTKKCYSARLKIVLLENFRDKTNRVLVYDEKSERVIDGLSNAFSESEEQMRAILEKIREESAESESPVEFTEEEKSGEQLEREKEQIAKQEELDLAMELNDQTAIAEIAKQEVKEKTLFSTLEFEAEFERLLGNASGEILLKSPWIKNATLKLIPLFEAFLKRGGRLLVAYSKPENPGDVMCYEKPFKKLRELEARYSEFYFGELPKFHSKLVFHKNHSFYCGSQNILSFHSNDAEDEENVREEIVTKSAWNEERENLYRNNLNWFGLKYLNEAMQKFDALCGKATVPLDRNFLKEVASFRIGKLGFFAGKNIEEFDNEYAGWLKEKEEKLTEFRTEFALQELLKIQTALKAEEEKTESKIVGIKNLDELAKKLGELCKEFPEAENWSERTAIENSLSELRERFYRNEFAKITEEIKAVKEADFKKKNFADFKNRLRKLSEEFPEAGIWIKEAELEKSLAEKYERAYKHLLFELLQGTKKLGETISEKRQVAEIQSRLKNICSEFPEAEKLPEKAEIEAAARELLVQIGRNKLANLRNDIDSKKGEIVPPSRVKDFTNRLNALVREFPYVELLEEKNKIEALLDECLKRYYQHKIAALQKDIEAKGNAIVAPAEFREFQNRLSEILKKHPDAKNWEATFKVEFAIEEFRERY